MNPALNKPRLHTLLGDYPNTRALKSGALNSDLLEFDFVEAKVPNQSFKRVVREFEFDIAELAIVTFLQAKSYGKPLVLLPAVVGTLPHGCWLRQVPSLPMLPVTRNWLTTRCATLRRSRNRCTCPFCW